MATSNQSSKKFYITTAIDYPNGAPHMGHAYEKVVTDTYARWHRLKGETVHFLTGTDENGQKLSKSAEEAGVETMKFVDRNVDIFRDLCKTLNISNDDFIRTTEERHKLVVHELWRKLESNGDIYFDRYSGNYCLSCETFYSETQAPEGKCPEHHVKLERIEEEGYFFKLGKYAEWVTQHIRSNEKFVVPTSSRNEVLNRIEAEPIKDLSISRPNKGWGIPVPGNEGHVIYTWFDALINYYSALQGDQKNFWPAQVHVIGRDIIWFHSFIWPAMLHAAGIQIPEQIYVHGMILAEDGRKMSKSLGNAQDPLEVIKTYPVDTFRYYLLRAMPSQGNGKFSIADLGSRHVSELGNDFGNLLMRIVKLLRKRGVMELSGEGVQVDFDFKPLYEEMDRLMGQFEHSKALDKYWSELNKLNAYVNEKAPWSVKGEGPELHAVAYNILYGIAVLCRMMLPFMPHSAKLTLECLGLSADGPMNFDRPKFTLSEPPMLFPRIEAPKA